MNNWTLAFSRFAAHFPLPALTPALLPPPPPPLVNKIPYNLSRLLSFINRRLADSRSTISLYWILINSHRPSQNARKILKTVSKLTQFSAMKRDTHSSPTNNMSRKISTIFIKAQFSYGTSKMNWKTIETKNSSSITLLKKRHLQVHNHAW